MKIQILAAAMLLAPTAAFPAQVPPPPKTMQWLYGSSEAAALDQLTFQSMARYAIDANLRRSQGITVESAVLAEGASPTAPAWRTCTRNQPSAVILDIDETALLNSGWNYDAARRGDPAFDPPRWGEWEQTGAEMVEPVPGAVEAVDALRKAGLVVLFVSNRDRSVKGVDIASQTVAALKRGGFGDVDATEQLFLSGDVGAGSGKDLRRARVSEKFCVVAMAGDQFGDFSDAFNAPRLADGKTTDVVARRALATSQAVRDRLGQGWYLLPNPVYGPGVAGGYDELFSSDKHWPKEK
jgi:5'-nucleotidase (lipoprotein e(P4) family)